VHSGHSSPAVANRACNQSALLCVWSCMGVLQAAMETASSRQLRPCALVAGEQDAPAPGKRDRLLPSAAAASLSGEAAQQSGREGRMQRTQEAEAAQVELNQLLRRCTAGDPVAWRLLVAGQHRRVYSLCYRFTGSASDAEDLTQEVFLKLFRNLPSFECERGSFPTWLAAMTRNLLVDHYRRTRLQRASQSLDACCASEEVGEGGLTLADRLPDQRASQLEYASTAELRERIQHALTQLSPELREAVILRDLEEMDYREIADVLQLPQGTVKSRISRGRRELARRLERIEGQVV